MARVVNSRDFTPPKNTGNEIVDRALDSIKNILDSHEGRLATLDETPVLKIFGTTTVGPSRFIEYKGAASSTVTLPKANSIEGLSSRFLIIANTGTGTLTIAANAGDTVNNAVSITLATNAFAILVSNGDTKWLSK